MNKRFHNRVAISVLVGFMIFAGATTYARIQSQEVLTKARDERDYALEKNIQLWRTVEVLQGEIKEAKELLVLRESPAYRTICSTNTWKSFESESAITNVNSVQYNLKEQATVETNFGFLWINKKYILVAMAPQYGSVSSKYLITFESGQSINVMIGDIKQADCVSPEDGSMIEFIVSLPAVPAYIRKAGNFDLVFRGSITSIMEVE